MLDILQQHLAENATPELLAVMQDAHTAFERLGMENYESGFEELLMIEGSEVAGTKSAVDSALELTQALLRQVLAAHAVVLSEDTPLRVQVDVINALLDLQSYSDLAALQATASLDGLPAEVFAELVALVSTYTPHELLVYVEDVSWFLIKRLRELCSRTLTSEEVAEQNERLERFRAKILLAQACQVLAPDLAVTRAVQDGLALGLPFTTYLQQFGWQLAQWDVARSGQELLAMALMSRDGIDNPRAVVSEHIEKYIPGLDRVTQIDVDIASRLLTLNHHEQA